MFQEQRVAPSRGPSKKLDARIAALERDLEHGAGLLTSRGVEILRDACAALPRARWAEELPRVAERVSAAKPAMAGLRNAVALLLNDLLELGPDGADGDARELAWRLTDGLRRVGDMAADNAASALGPQASVATCSYSSAVTRTLVAAVRFGPPGAVVVYEPCTRPDAPGRRLADAIAAAGWPASVHAGPASEVVELADLVLVGADAVATGAFVNGAPTAELAAAALARVPFYVVCETIKFTDDVAPVPGYDRVPLEQVTDVITETGRLSRPAIADYLTRRGRAVPRW